MPSNLRARLLSIWLKAWNSLSMSTPEMPMPLSATQISRNSVYSLGASEKPCTGHRSDTLPTSPRGTRRACSTTRPPLALNFTAFDSRL